MRKKIIPLVITGCLLTNLSIQPSYAVIPVTDAALNGQTTTNQIMNYIVYVEQLINSYQSLTNQLSQLQNEAKHLLTLPMSAWENARNSLNQMANLMQQGNNISYSMSNLSAKFKELYPGYDDYSSTSGQTYQEQYSKMADDNMQNLNNTMQALKQNHDDMDNESALVDQLKTLSGSAQGDLQAVQVGNQIGAEQIAQLQKMRALMMAQTQAQTKYMAMETQRQAASEKAVDDMLQNVDTSWSPYKNDSNLGNIPMFM